MKQEISKSESENSKPRVSVVMSVYNGQKFLNEAIESILSQTFKAFEFIIVDDGSTDNSLEIIKSYAKIDKRIRIIKNKKNLGLTKSLNKALSAAKAKYIARQDSDDVSLPERLEKQYCFLETHKSYGLVGTGAIIIDSKARPIKKSFIIKNNAFIKLYLRLGNCFFHGSVMFRKSLFLKLRGYNEFFKRSQDYELWTRFALISKLYNLNSYLYLWRQTKKGISKANEEEQDRYAAVAALAYYLRRKSTNHSFLFWLDSSSNSDIFNSNSSTPNSSYPNCFIPNSSNSDSSTPNSSIPNSSNSNNSNPNSSNKNSSKARPASPDTADYGLFIKELIKGSPYLRDTSCLLTKDTSSLSYTRDLRDLSNLYKIKFADLQLKKGKIKKALKLYSEISFWCFLVRLPFIVFFIVFSTILRRVK